MRYWQIDQVTGGSLDLIRAGGLIAAISDDNLNALPQQMLALLNDVVPLSQCTIFAYEQRQRPRTLAVADHRGGNFLHNIAETYARSFYALDGNQAVVAQDSGKRLGNTVTLHHQCGADIEHEAYRELCYRRPNVSDRLSLLMQPASGVWLSVNFYRDNNAGSITPAEIRHLEALAPVLGHAACNHYLLKGQAALEVSHIMLLQLQRACPQLSKRELDVLRGVLEGNTASEIADLMGIQRSSVQTYQKRAYRRLGISSQRQLFALGLSGKIR